MKFHLIITHCLEVDSEYYFRRSPFDNSKSIDHFPTEVMARRQLYSDSYSREGCKALDCFLAHSSSGLDSEYTKT